jgi:hypothetical protein
VTLRAEDLLKQTYAAFNARNIEAALALMSSEVAWPNGMEGGVVHGHAGVREYWTRQWSMIDPHVEPLRIREGADGGYDVEVKQIVRDPQGTVLVDKIVHHVFQLHGGLIASMEIRE